MSFIKRAIQKANSKLITLKSTKYTHEEDLELPQWQFLKDEYTECQTEPWLTKAVLSICNSIIYQQRVFFVLTKKSARELFKSDKNWKKPIGLKDENYKKLIQELTESDLIRLVKKDGQAYVYELISPED